MSCFVVIVAADECRWRQGGEWTATLLALKAIAHSTSAYLSQSSVLILLLTQAYSGTRTCMFLKGLFIINVKTRKWSFM